MAKKATRTVLVTGASRGLGLGIARQLAGAGYGVIALARKETKAVTDAIAATKRAKQGALHFVSFDLGKIDARDGVQGIGGARVVWIVAQQSSESRRRLGILITVPENRGRAKQRLRGGGRLRIPNDDLVECRDRDFSVAGRCFGVGAGAQDRRSAPRSS